MVRITSINGNLLLGTDRLCIQLMTLQTSTIELAYVNNPHLVHDNCEQTAYATGVDLIIPHTRGVSGDVM